MNTPTTITDLQQIQDFGWETLVDAWEWEDQLWKQYQETLINTTEFETLNNLSKKEAVKIINRKLDELLEKQRNLGNIRTEWKNILLNQIEDRKSKWQKYKIRIKAPKKQQGLEYNKETAKQIPCEQFLSGGKKRGKLTYFKCPFHNERTPSFCLYPNNTWYCFSCSAWGDVITLVQRSYNYNFQEAINFLLKI